MSNSDVYVIGGETNPSEPMNSVEKFDGIGFELLPNIDLSFSRHCALAYDSTKIIITGGIVSENLFSERSFIYNTRGK